MDPYVRQHFGRGLVALVALVLGLLLVASESDVVGGAGSVLALLGLAYVLVTGVRVGLHLMRDETDATPPR